MDNRAPTSDELSRMEAMVDQAMLDGAFGLSSALIYVPGTFAKTDELLALAKVAARHKGIYISHIRGESFNLFNAIDEAIGIGRDAGLAGGHLSPEGRREGELGPHERSGRGDRQGERRRGARLRDDVSLCRGRHRAGGDAAAVGAGRRPRQDARAPQGSGDTGARRDARSRRSSMAGKTS